MSTDEEGCESCGAVPAMLVEFTALIHFLVFAQVEQDRGVRCRECALALYRRHVSMTLVLGWWGVALLAVPLCIWRNRRALARVQHLGPVRNAGPAAGRFVVGVDGTIFDMGISERHGRPLDAGRPLRMRISSYTIVYVLIVLTIVVFIIHNSA